MFETLCGPIKAAAHAASLLSLQDTNCPKEGGIQLSTKVAKTKLSNCLRNFSYPTTVSFEFKVCLLLYRWPSSKQKILVYSII